MFGGILNTPMYYNFYVTCKVILGSISSVFKHIQVLFKSIFTHIQNLLHPWHNQNPDILKSSTVFTSLPDILQCLWKIVPGYNYFCKEPLGIISKSTFLETSNFWPPLPLCSSLFVLHVAPTCLHCHIYNDTKNSICYLKNQAIFFKERTYR